MRNLLGPAMSAFAAFVPLATLATAQEQSVGEEALTLCEEEGAQQAASKGKPCESYEGDVAEGTEKRVRPKREAQIRKVPYPNELRGGFGPAAPRPSPPGHAPH